MKTIKIAMTFLIVVVSVLLNSEVANCSNQQELFKYNGYSTAKETEIIHDGFLRAIRFSMESLVSPDSRTLKKLLWAYGISEEEFKKLPVATGVMAIENLVNTISYVQDEYNWGKKDYFVDIKNFFSHGGDCEDYAIAKLALIKFFYPSLETHFIVLQDINLRIAHAISVVVLNEVAYVLDNEMPTTSPRLVRLDKMYHYLPLYSANFDTGRIRIFLPDKVGGN